MTRFQKPNGPVDHGWTILAGMVAVACFIVAAWVETEHFADLAHWSRELGRPMVGKYYAPFSSIGWMLRYDLHVDVWRLKQGLTPVYINPREAAWARTAFATERIHVLIELTASFILFIVLSAIWYQPQPTRGLYGRASWGSGKHSSLRKRQAKLTGIVLGQGRFGKLYIQNGQESVLVLGPPGSGKSDGIAVPTLVSAWRQSAIVFDPAGELYARTGAARAQMGNVYVFDLRSSKTARFNPLAGLKADDIDHIQVILASYMFDRDISKMSEGSQFFAVSSLELGTALLARAIELDQGSFSGAASIYYGGNWPNDRAFCDALALSEVTYVRQTATKYAKMDDELRSNVISSLTRYLAVFRSDDVVHATEHSDFSACSFRESTTTLYLTVRERDQPALNPVLRMVLSRLLDDLTSTIPDPHEQSVLAMLDEFPLLKAPVIEQKLGTMRKYRIRPVLLAQAITQIRDYYGQHESVTGLCDVRVFFPHAEHATQEFASKTCGDTSVWSESKSHGDRLSRSYHEVSRALLLPGDLGALGKNRLVITKKGEAPLLAVPVRAYRDRRFRVPKSP